MDVLILGLSSIVSRRALPALRALPRVGRIDLATRKASDPAVRASWEDGEIYADYAEALSHSSAELVYVSLVNSEHEPWTRAALEHDRHVVVDKPALLGRASAETLVDLAARRSRCLAEATVFGYHPQIAMIQQAFADAGLAPTRISVLLSFPPLDPGNFRYQPSLGGGALWDVGPYLVAASRVFFGEEPSTTDCRILARGGDGVELAFSALGGFPGGRSLMGHFGFDTAYCNRLQLIGPTISLELDRAFTTPGDYANTIRGTVADQPVSIAVPPADSFGLFFDHLTERIEAADWRQLTADLLMDARSLERYRATAGVL